MNINPGEEKPIECTIGTGRRFWRVDAGSSHKGKKEAHCINQESQPKGRPPVSFSHGQSNTPDCTARLYRWICSFRLRTTNRALGSSGPDFCRILDTNFARLNLQFVLDSGQEAEPCESG